MDVLYPQEGAGAVASQASIDGPWPRRSRIVVLAFVLLAHVAVIRLLFGLGGPAARVAPQGAPLTLLLLTSERAMQHDATPTAERELHPAQRRRKDAPPARVLDGAAAPAPAAGGAGGTAPVPQIDWTEEAQRAARDAVARQAAADGRRNLAGLSAAQRRWFEENHMQPAVPGMRWTHPRVDLEGGLPIIWINDHCVSVPMLLMMVFCRVGHIEPNGDLFDHMRDPEASER